MHKKHGIDCGEMGFLHWYTSLHVDNRLQPFKVGQINDLTCFLQHFYSIYNFHDISGHITFT